MTEPVVIVSSLGKCYSINRPAKKKLGGGLKRLADLLPYGPSAKTPDSAHWALKDISFTVNRGERIGIIGRNGAGKSTLLKIMSRVSYPTTGEVRIRGTMTSLLEVGTGFNDNLSGRENVFLNASLYGMTSSEVESKFDDIVAFSEVGRFIDTPVKHYSSGMRMRLAFSVAAHLEPDILLLDEVLAVGDMSFQRKCLERVDDLTSQGQTLFFVSHSMDSIMRYCNRCIWLDDGVMRMDGDVQEVISAYVEAVLKVQSAVTSPISKLLTQDEEEFDYYESAQSETVEAVTSAGQPNLFAKPFNSTDGARLVSARVIDSNSVKKSVFSVNEAIGIEMTYEIMGPGVYVPAVHVYCPHGTLLFVAVPPETDLSQFKKGEHSEIISTAWFPAHIFNTGTYSVSLIVFSPVDSPFKRFFNHEQVLSYHCIEARVGELSAKGVMPRVFPGSIRPLLKWTLVDKF